MKKLTLLTLAGLLLQTPIMAQNHFPPREHSSHHAHKKVSQKTHDHQHDHGGANHHMHQASTEELIKRFESPERDAYQQPQKVLEYLGNLKNKTIMDLGAGSGYFSSKLAKQGANVIAADVDDTFLSYMKERFTKEKLTHIALRKIPYDNPLLNDKEVDMVLVVNTYHHIENRSDYFSKVKKGLKEKGELIIIDFFSIDLPMGPPAEMKISIDQVVAELKAAGFASFDVNVNLLPYQFVIKAHI